MAEPSLARERLEQAAHWHLVSLDKDVSADDFAQMLAWCDADPLNRDALERIQQAWVEAGALAPEAGVEIAGALRETWPDRRVAPERHSWLASLTALLGGRRPGLRAAAVLAGAAAVVWISGLLPHAVDERVEHLASAHGASESATLPDGSTVELGGRSAVSVLYTGKHRLLIAEDGEAFYRVRKDTARPFVVRAGRLTATAVGTAFSVRRDGESVSVLVSEGVVDVRLDMLEGHASSPPVMRASAGQLVRYDRGQLTSSATPGANAATGAAWRAGRLQFVDEPLRLVVADINRYSKREIVIADAAIGELRFTGTVFVPHLDDWLAGIAAVYQVTVSEAADKRVLITRTKQGA
jgi:transmembrane sensor